MACSLCRYCEAITWNSYPWHRTCRALWGALDDQTAVKVDGKLPRKTKPDRWCITCGELLRPDQGWPAKRCPPCGMEANRERNRLRYRRNVDDKILVKGQRRCISCHELLHPDQGWKAKRCPPCILEENKERSRLRYRRKVDAKLAGNSAN